MEEAVNGDRLKMRQGTRGGCYAGLLLDLSFYPLCEREIQRDSPLMKMVSIHGASLDAVFVLSQLNLLPLLTWGNVAMLQVREERYRAPFLAIVRHSAALPAILRVFARAGFTITRSSANHPFVTRVTLS